MKITVTFDVDPNGSDPAKMGEYFEHYIREMLEIGYIDDNDPFTITDCQIERALFQV